MGRDSSLGPYVSHVTGFAKPGTYKFSTLAIYSYNLKFRKATILNFTHRYCQGSSYGVKLLGQFFIVN